MKAVIFTLGCKVNDCESASLAHALRERGWEVSETLEDADLFILNTCAVTAEAEKKSRQAVARIRDVSPHARIAVCGCAAERAPAAFAQKEGVFLVTGAQSKGELIDLLASHARGVCIRGESAYGELPAPQSAKSRAFVKIQDGCNNFCSYCIIPYLRGRTRSRSLESAAAEILSSPAEEVVITGIDVSSYNDGGRDLADLLLAVKDAPARIRLGSLEAGVVTERLLAAAKQVRDFAPHFHLSLQSGDDGVLRDMNRHYTAAEYAEKVALIREKFPGAAVTTDVIVGFPTETDEAFERSLAFCAEMSFADMHVFPYSSRKGTAAGKLRTIDPRVVAEREKKMLAMKRELSEKFRLSVLGKPAEVLFETREDGMWCGHTPEYVKVYASEGARGAVSSVVPTALFGDGVRV